MAHRPELRSGAPGPGAGLPGEDRPRLPVPLGLDLSDAQPAAHAGAHGGVARQSALPSAEEPARGGGVPRGPAGHADRGLRARGGRVMPAFSTTRRVPFTPRQMYDLVADVEKYPQFLPLCEALVVRSRAIEGDKTALIAGMTVGYKAIRETFTSRVVLDP